MKKHLRTTNPKNMSLAEAYEYCLKMERDRERKWRKTKQGAFEFSMGSLDKFRDEMEDPDKMRVFSDFGKGAEMIADDLDNDPLYGLSLGLSEKDTRFVRDILRGLSWKDLGYTEKSYFYRRVKNICKKLNRGSHQTCQKGRYKT